MQLVVIVLTSGLFLLSEAFVTPHSPINQNRLHLPTSQETPSRFSNLVRWAQDDDDSNPLKEAVKLFASGNMRKEDFEALVDTILFYFD